MEVGKNPVKITDTTLRDGHQSSLATRMRTEDMEPIAEEMDKAKACIAALAAKIGLTATERRSYLELLLTNS